MANFLFWNMARKPLRDSLARLANWHAIDLLLVAECPLSPRQVTNTLNQSAKAWQFAPPLINLGEHKIQIFTRFKPQMLVELLAAPRWTIRELRLPDVPAILIAAVHLPSKLHWDSDSQAFECVTLADDIRAVETAVGHRRTLVVGDFNMNPFEAGMLAANALHGESSRRIAQSGGRVVGEHRYEFFYNPMWNFFGDGARGPGGTYFYRGSERVRLSWNLFDQVLLRPDLLARFDTAQLEILQGDGEVSFLTRGGTPTTRLGSDHLPITFKLDL